MHAESWWELSRRVYLDTRFELNVDLDHDGDSTELELIDGGITSTQSPPSGSNYPSHHADWSPRNGRTEGTVYYDFLIEVPEANEEQFLGYIGYGTDSSNVRLLVFGNRYELWTYTGTPAQVGSSISAPGGSTAGVHNIGLVFGGGVWIDGTHYSRNPTLNGGDVTVRFGTHSMAPNLGTPGIKLFEQLTYVESYERSRLSKGPSAGGGGDPGTGTGTGGILGGGGGNHSPRPISGRFAPSIIGGDLIINRPKPRAWPYDALRHVATHRPARLCPNTYRAAGFPGGSLIQPGATHGRPVVIFPNYSISGMTTGRPRMTGSPASSPTAARTMPGLFETAEGGTLFLDEIADTPLEIQARLLRAVEQQLGQRLNPNPAHSQDQGL